MRDRFLLRMRCYDALSYEEEAICRSFAEFSESSAEGSDIVLAGSRPAASTLLLDGFAACYSILSDGKRQITAIHVPGDFLDLDSFVTKKMDHGIVALTACAVAKVSHIRLKQLTRDQPHLTRLLWLATLVDSAIHRRWLVEMGAKRAAAHMAHLFCEMHLRLSVVGLTDGGRFFLPVTQSVMGDALGRSVVHINRVAQQLRRTGLLKWSRFTVELPDLPALKALAEFDPTYLYLQHEQR